MKKRTFFLFLTTTILAALAGGRLIALIQSESVFSNSWLNKRYSTALESFAKLQGESVFVFGASEIESGFRPEVFNHTLKATHPNLKSYNFAFRNVGPMTLGALVEQMHFSKRPDLKIKAVYLKFAPFYLTERSRIAAETSEEEAESNIFSNSYLRAHPNARNLSALYVKNVQGGFSTAGLSESGRSLLYQAASRLTGQNLMIAQATDVPRYQLWIDRQFNQAPEWDLQNGGFHDRTINHSQDELNQIYLAQQMPDSLEQNFRIQELRTDIVSLNFSADLIETLRKQLREMRKLTDNVVLFYFPDHPALPRSVQTKIRLNRVLADLCKTEGVRCLRFDQAETFRASDYYDAFHLMPEAVDRLSTLLAEDYQQHSGQ